MPHAINSLFQTPTFRKNQEIAPFRFVELSGSIFSTAIGQDWAAGPHHVRVLDRLHLAAMEELKVRRIMTNDANQAAAARAFGWTVVIPA